MEPSRSTALEELPTPSAPKRFELPWLILGALLISTVWGAWQTSVQQTAEARARFAELAVHERTEIEERLGEMRELTASVAALVAALPGVDSAAWNRFFDSRDKGGSRRPGLIGFQYLPPQGSRLPQLERRLDGTSGAQRPWAAHAKIGPLLELRNVQLSEPILDGTELGLKSAGYALAVPVAAERGHVVALIDFAALARGGKRADQGIALEVRDGSAVLYRSGDAARTASPSMQSESRIAFAGRPLTLTAASTPALELRLANNTPRTVLLIGLVSCALLAGLIWLLSRLRDQATAMAERMTRQLHEQTRFTEELIEFNPNPIFRKDAAGRLISVNRAWEQLAGRARESVLGKRYAEFLPESAAAAIESHDAAVLASPSGRAVIEAPFVNAEGRQFETIIAKQALSDRDGRVSGLIGTLTDVTQIKELEHALAQQREQLDLVIRSSQQGIWDIQDIVGAKPYFSERFMEIVGYQPQDFPDAYEWRDVVHPDDQVEFQKNLMQLLRRQVDLFDVETRLRCKNGEYTWVRARGIAQYAANGRVSRFTGSITDISDRKRAEQDLLAANERVTEAARAKEAFLAMMSHEMRTPLNGVLGMASLLGETSLDDEQKDYIRLIRASGDTLLRLIDDVLDFSKIESGHMTLEALPVELVPLIEEAFELVADKARGKHLALLFDFDDSAPYFVVGDATRIRQILLNLLANAIKFTEEGEIGVRVTASPTRDGRIRVEIAVSDTGIGIPADRLDQLFQPFTQVDASTTRKYGGTGLGLAICRRLTQLMGGDIRAESREGKGSTFIATIVSELARGPIQPYMQRNVAEFTGKRLLVVDQSPRRREIMGRRYRIWGLDTVVASHEEAAEVLSARGPFDILLSDTVLPTPEATALAEALDAEDRRRDAAGAPHIVSILASMQVRTELAQRQLVPKLRHDFFVIRPIGRTRMFDLLLHAALGQREIDFATRPFGKEMAVERGREAKPAPASRPHAGRTLRLLLAEDNEVNQRVILGMLRNMGHSCVQVADGLEAVRAATPGLFDAILLDVQMPVMDGVEAMKQIRKKLGDESCPPIIAMTAHALPGDREHYLSIGMDDYLPKPIRVATLATVLGRLEARLKPPEPKAMDSTLPILDLEQLADLRGLPASPDEPGDDAVDGLINMFRTQTAERLEIMQSRLALADWKGLSETAHSLRGASASVGYPRVSMQCKDIEATARTLAGTPGKMAQVAGASSQMVAKQLADLRTLVEEADAALAAWLQGTGQPVS